MANQVVLFSFLAQFVYTIYIPCISYYNSNNSNNTARNNAIIMLFMPRCQPANGFGRIEPTTAAEGRARRPALCVQRKRSVSCPKDKIQAHTTVNGSTSMRHTLAYPDEHLITDQTSWSCSEHRSLH